MRMATGSPATWEHSPTICFARIFWIRVLEAIFKILRLRVQEIKKRDDPSGASLEVTFLNTKADQSIGLVFGRPLRTFWPGFQRPSSVSMLMRSYLLRTFLFFRILPEAFKLGCLDMLSTPVVKLSFKTYNILPFKKKSNTLWCFFQKIRTFFYVRNP